MTREAAPISTAPLALPADARPYLLHYFKHLTDIADVGDVLQDYLLVGQQGAAGMRATTEFLVPLTTTLPSKGCSLQ